MTPPEWRAVVGEKLENIEETLAAVCTNVRRHDTDIAVIQKDLADRKEAARDAAKLGGWSRIYLAGVTIMAATSIVVALIALLG